MQPKEDAFDRTERRRAEHEAAARDFSHILFGPPETESPKAKEGEGKEDPVGSADAGEHGKVMPENRRAPAEHLADILLRGEGVPAEPWRRGL